MKSQYQLNIEQNQIKARCPKCGFECMIFPEYLGKIYCFCDTILITNLSQLEVDKVFENSII